MQAIFFALVAYLGWGVGDIFGTISTRRINSYSVTIWFEVFSIIFMLPLCFIFQDQLKLITFPIFLLTVFLAILVLAGLVLFYEALNRGNSTVVGTVVSCFAAIAVVLSIIFMGEKVTIFQSLAITTIFTGVIISSLNFKDLKGGKIFKDKTITIALTSMLLFGIYFAFIKVPIDAIGWFWPAFITALTFPVIFIPIYLFKIKIQKPTMNKALVPLVLNALLLSSAALSYNIGIERGLTSIVAPIAGSYPTLFALLSYFVFKDPIKKREIYGIVFTLIGIVLLSVSHI